jgi:hypothetical protein
VDWGSQPGGILKVLKLIEDHGQAFVYDFRSRFGLGMSDVGTVVPWGEVVNLVLVLLRDPSSWLHTSVNGWSHPISYEWPVLASIYDLHAQVNSKRKPKPFPRPWANAGVKRPKPRANAREILRRARNGELKWQNKAK